MDGFVGEEESGMIGGVCARRGCSEAVFVDCGDRGVVLGQEGEDDGCWASR